MSALNDERRPGQGGESSNVTTARVCQQGTTAIGQDADRRAEPINVWAHAYIIVGTRGRCRLVLIVAHCPFCRRPHSHNGRPDFLMGQRTASCHAGRYVVHLGTVEGQVAA